MLIFISWTIACLMIPHVLRSFFCLRLKNGFSVGMANGAVHLPLYKVIRVVSMVFWEGTILRYSWSFPFFQPLAFNIVTSLKNVGRRKVEIFWYRNFLFFRFG